MDNDSYKDNTVEENSESDLNMGNGANQSDHSEGDEKSGSGPAAVLLWAWNWLTALPQTVCGLCTDIKNGELLAKFSFIDAMLQFIFAVATSCHPPEEAYSSEPDEKQETSSKEKDVKPFAGTGRSLRSRAVPSNS